MYISEIFHSIQGEGELTGTPSLFIRTAGCNLRCAWCDTPHASWSPDGSITPLNQILATAAECPSAHVVLTGGEPMIAPELPELAEKLKALGKHLTIETAATVPPNGIACDLASLSPKLSNSIPRNRVAPAWRKRHEQRRWQPAVVRQWIDAYPYQLKFVLSVPGDLEEMEAMLHELDRTIPPENVLLMPEGISHDALSEKTEWLTGICRQRGYRYCPRLQIELFGNRRGT